MTDFPKGVKVLYADIETSPAIGAFWSLFKPVFNTGHIIEHPRILGVAYKWSHWKKAKWISEQHQSNDDMLRELHELVSEADIVVGYNSKRFDWRWLKSSFIAAGLPPVPEVKHIDLFSIWKANAYSISNKLDYVAQRLINDQKQDAGGMETWLGCMNGDREAWAQLGRYARQDVDLLPPITKILLPWGGPGLPNLALMAGVEGLACPACASKNFQRRGYFFTNTGKYQRLQCQDCGKWFRNKNRITTTEGR